MPANIEKRYELRDLMADDLFIVVNIISKIGVKEFKACFESEEVKAAVLSVMKKTDGDGKARTYGEGDIVSIGVSVALDIAAILMANIGKCKSDIYALLSNLSGMKEKEIAKLPLKTFTDMIFDLVRKKEFADFFQDAAKFLK